MNLQIFKTKCNTTERVFVGILTVSILLLTYNILTYSPCSLLTILIYIICLTIFLLLAYIAYVDFKTMEIHNEVSLILLFFLLVLNLFLHFYLPPDTGLNIGNNLTYLPYDNFVSTLYLGSISLLLVLASKEKALGAGDIRIGLITGLLIGQHSILIWLYITVFSSLLYGLVIAYREKKIRNLKIPFAPFMILGGIVSVLINLYT